MKYKLIIIIFNIFVLLSFSTICLLPLILLGPDYFAEFWLANWFLALIFLIIILMVNAFFVYNWPIVRYTKTGKWDALVAVLEKRIYGRKIITYSNVRLLTYSYFLLGRKKQIKTLEKHIKGKRKSIYNKAFLMFSCANLISDSNDHLKAYFEEAVNNKSLKGMDWILINYAFVLIANKEFDKALAMLKKIDGAKNNPILELTKLYFLFMASKLEDQKAIALLKENFTKKISDLEFEKRFEIEKGDIHILFLSKIISQAKEWAYPTGLLAKTEERAHSSLFK
ncbi:MAG: hypothetical protein FWC36_10500 [Spirochaetes bacterium]|nr:hypothetical protein [Spirochaetota bacterium]